MTEQTGSAEAPDSLFHTNGTKVKEKRQKATDHLNLSSVHQQVAAPQPHTQTGADGRPSSWSCVWGSSGTCLQGGGGGG